MREQKATSFKIDKEVFDELKKEAKQNGRSINKQLDYHLAKDFKIDLTVDKGE